MRIIRICVALFGLFAALVPALTQEKYPNRPVHFIVSFAAGGSNDIIARVLCDWLSAHFGQQFAAPRQVATRRAGQHQRAHPLGAAGGDDLAQDAAHRRTHDVGRLEA